MTAQELHRVEGLIPGHCAFCREGLPVDPESPDATRPTDLDDCPACRGAGTVTYSPPGDPAGEWDETCRACGGTGQRGAA